MALTIDYRNSSCICVTEYHPDPGETIVIIPEGVDRINADVFLGCDNLQKIVFPESIRLIEERAFKGCSNLSEVVLHGKPNFDRICDDAFDECPNLVIDGMFIALGDILFKYVGDLDTVTVPNRFTRIADGAFDADEHFVLKTGDHFEAVSKKKDVQIKNIVLPDSIEEIGGGAFSCCAELKSINIPSKVKKICYGAFYQCTSLECIEIPPSVLEIEDTAFEGCTALKSVKMHEGIRKIGVASFEKCSKLKDVQLPLSLESIGQNAFADTQIESLQALNVTKIDMRYWQHAVEPYYIFPKVKIVRGMKPFFCLHLALGYCVAVELYSNEVAKTYDKYIQNKGGELIHFAKSKGVAGVEEFCTEHGYIKPIADENGKDEQALVLDGTEYFVDDIDLNGYVDGYNGGKLPSNEQIRDFVDHNFYTYSFCNVKNAACLGKCSMALCILLLDGVLKSQEFHSTKEYIVFGSWFSLMYEGYGITDARDRELTTFFDRLMRSFIEYGIVFKVQLPDKSDTVFVIRDYEKYLSDAYEPDFPEKLIAKVNRQISSWCKEIKELD